jgi:hypothetical protein
MFLRSFPWSFFNVIGECRTVNQFHDEIVRADVEQGADVGVVQRGDGIGFAPEAVGELGLRELNDNFAAEPRVPRAPDFAHAAFADEIDQLIGAELSRQSRRGHEPVSIILTKHGAGLGRLYAFSPITPDKSRS